MKFLTRKLVTPADLNPRGTLHGGQLLKWIDEEGGIHAFLPFLFEHNGSDGLEKIHKELQKRRK